MTSKIWLEMRRRGLAALVSALALGAAHGQDTVHLSRVPEGGVQPQAEMEAEGTLHLVYLKGEPAGCDVFYVQRKAGQKGFTTPIRVNSEPGSAVALGTVRGAQLALGPQGRVHVVWNGSSKGEEGKGGGADMFYTRLAEDGQSFEPQRNLMKGTKGLDGGGSVAADLEGNVYVVWHGRGPNEPEGEKYRAVFVARSTDNGKTFAPEREARSGEMGACGCCGLKAFAGEHGLLAVLYRSANQKGGRDATLLLSTNYADSFQSRVLGAWKVEKCPMTTQALGAGPGESLIAMWETQGQVYRTAINPARFNVIGNGVTPFRNPGNRKYPVFALGKGQPEHLLMAWVEGAGWGAAGTLAWECADWKSGVGTPGHAGAVPVWSYAAAVAEQDGSFTVIY